MACVFRRSTLSEVSCRGENQLELHVSFIELSLLELSEKILRSLFLMRSAGSHELRALNLVSFERWALLLQNCRFSLSWINTHASESKPIDASLNRSSARRLRYENNGFGGADCVRPHCAWGRLRYSWEKHFLVRNMRFLDYPFTPPQKMERSSMVIYWTGKVDIIRMIGNSWKRSHLQIGRRGSNPM